MGKSIRKKDGQRTFPRPKYRRKEVEIIKPVKQVENKSSKETENKKETKTASKKSGLKRLGIDSVHYYGNNVVLTYGFANQTLNNQFTPTIFQIPVYKDVNTLKECLDEDIALDSVHRKGGDKEVQFQDLVNEVGFKITYVNPRKSVERPTAKVTSIKKKSLLQELVPNSIPTENNFDAQIFANFEDIRKSILIKINDLVYSIGSLNEKENKTYKEDREVAGIFKTFDTIGTMTYKTPLFKWAVGEGTDEKYNKKFFDLTYKVLSPLGKLIDSGKEGKVKWFYHTWIKEYVEQCKLDSTCDLPCNNKDLIISNYYLANKNVFLKKLNEALFCGKNKADYKKYMNKVLESKMGKTSVLFHMSNSKSAKAENEEDEEISLRNILSDSDKKNDSKDEGYQGFFLPAYDYESLYNFVRVISAFRQICVHFGGMSLGDVQDIFETDEEASKSSISNGRGLIKTAQKDFVDNFNQNNNKYFAILEELYPNEIDLPEKFYKFILKLGKDNTYQNLSISVRALRKVIVKELICEKNPAFIKEYGDDNNLLDRTATEAEFRNKFNTLLDYKLFYFYTAESNKNIYSDDVNFLKGFPPIECRGKTDEEIKEEMYRMLYIKRFRDEANDLKLNDVVKTIVKHLGEKQYENEISFKPSEVNMPRFGLFASSLYYLTYLMVRKDANELISIIIGKLESILSLVNLAKKVSVKISLETDLYKPYKSFCFNDDNQGNDLTSDGLLKLISQLHLIRIFRLKVKKQKKEITQQDYRKIYYSLYAKMNEESYAKFEESLNKCEEENHFNKNKIYPFKAYLRKDIYTSKSYQYLSEHSLTNLCPLIIKKKPLVRFVLEEIDRSMKQSEVESEISSYLSNIWTKYSANKGIPYGVINKLACALSEFSGDKLNNYVFNNQGNNIKALTSLYYNVCYLLVKNIIRQNAAYSLGFQEMELIFEKIPFLFGRNKKGECKWHLLDVLKLRKQKIDEKSVTSKLSKSEKQINALWAKSKNMKLIKENGELENCYSSLLTIYRNAVEHVTLLARDSKSQDYDPFRGLEEIQVQSYFQIYQIIMQRNYLPYVNESNYDVVRSKIDAFNSHKKEERDYSNEMCIALNLPLAFNISRFNNLTVSKYAIKYKK